MVPELHYPQSARRPDLLIPRLDQGNRRERDQLVSVESIQPYFTRPDHGSADPDAIAWRSRERQRLATVCRVMGHLPDRGGREPGMAIVVSVEREVHGLQCRLQTGRPDGHRAGSSRLPERTEPRTNRDRQRLSALRKLHRCQWRDASGLDRYQRAAMGRGWRLV